MWDPHKSDMLAVAIQGKGAFRRFKDTMRYVGLEDEWYRFKDAAYKLKAIEWCDENEIPYIDDAV
ncbi:hypothetical protein FACS1894184_09110 [Clostridia bacterium]|nr:hypothetical protein FACS1894184_09110 [Clostridia bacterium]